ncbi:MAG: hypothetical protein MUF48_01020 [Pirellulaceae bacterium]|jgi:hypothetical protein|nr:hypothetical protein [Pirellulaceae bacterium]
MEQTIVQVWDYVVEEVSGTEPLRVLLSRLGAEGWELVHLSREASGDAAAPVKTLRARRGADYCAVLKRPRG